MSTRPVPGTFASEAACTTYVINASPKGQSISCSCSGGASTTGSRTAAPAAPATPANSGNLTTQQKVVLGAAQAAMPYVQQAVHDLFYGTPAPPPDPAEEQRQLASQQLNNSGIYLLKQRNYTGAINEFEQALAITPNEGRIVQNLEMAKQAQKNTAAAGRTGDALGQLLGTTPETAGSTASTLNLVSPDSDTSVTNAAASTAQDGQAPDAATKKITELVQGGSYAEAQQLTAGLLIAYPNDQRLLKAKALIEKLLAPGGSTNADPANSLPAQPVANTNAEQLAGMDKVDYTALIELARQAKQTTDPAEQTKLLQQFMNESITFLQKHPDQTLLWQLRATVAISLNDPMAGYEAGQKLIASGATDRADPNLQQLLAQLKNKHWLDKEQAENAARESKYDWLSGAFLGRYDSINRWGHLIGGGGSLFEFSRSNAIIEGRSIAHGKLADVPSFTVTILNSGDISCEGNEWNPVLSCEIDSVKRTMKVVVSDPTNKEHKGMTDHWEIKPNISIGQ